MDGKGIRVDEQVLAVLTEAYREAASGRITLPPTPEYPHGPSRPPLCVAGLATTGFTPRCGSAGRGVVSREVAPTKYTAPGTRAERMDLRV